MQLQPDHADAKEGYIRAGAVIRALLEYEKRIDAAEVLANKNEFQNARAQFNEAMAVKPDYLVTSERVQQLRSLIMAQSQPVDVTFKSDGRTYVQITNFKMLSQFDTMVVKIFPGDYEIVGRRKGYVDTRMMLQVRNGVSPPTVTVACNVADSRR
jgi:hypothetical protein